MRFKLTAFYLLLASLAACAKTPETGQKTPAATVAQPSPQSIQKTGTIQPSPAEAVRVTTEKVELRAGGAGEGIVQLKIVSPFHINANPPSGKNLIATEIELSDQNGIAAGKPVYPKGEMKTFGFSPDKPLSVYTGEAAIRVPLKAAANAQKAQQSLNGKLKFQPCDEEVCYKPQTMDVILPVTIN